MISAFKKSSWLVAVIFSVGLFIRGFVFNSYLQHDMNYWQVDSFTYEAVGKSIAQGKGIATASGAPNFHRLPGYPLYLALFEKCFGTDGAKAALWVQVALGACIPVLMYYLSLTLFPAQAGLAWMAGLYGAAHLGLVLYSGFMMTETLFILFFLLFMLLFFAHRDDPKRLAAAGVTLGIASLVRPVGHYLVVLALLVLLLQHSHWHVKLRNSVLLFVAWLIPVSMWLARNYLLLGQLFFHTLPGGHFLNLSASRVVMYSENLTYQQARVRVASEGHRAVRKIERAEHKKLSEIERCNVYEKLAINHFIAHPLISLKIWATDMFRAAFSLFSAELLYLDSGRKEIDYFANGRTIGDMIKRYLLPETENRTLKAVVWLEVLLFLGLLLGFVRSLWRVCRRGSKQEKRLWATLLSFMALFIVIALAGGYARMRLPIEPLIVILGLHGYVATHKKARKA